MAKESKPKMTWKEKWNSYPPGLRRKIVTFAALGAVVLLAFAALGGGGGSKVRTNSAKSQITNALIPGEDARELGINGISTDVATLQAQGRQKDQKIAQLKAAIAQNRSSQLGGSTAATRKMAQQLHNLQNQIAVLQSQNEHAAKAAPVPTAAHKSKTGANQQPAQPAPVAPPPKPVIRHIAEKPKPRPKEVSVKRDAPGTKIPTMYLPSGTILTGVNITGLDAATGKGAMSNPIPILVRIKHDAILPNRYRADVRECFVLASGYGDLASERAYLRASSISCVRKDGRVIDIKVEMIAIGPDGKAGIRGRLVSRQGQVIAKAAMAGLAQGIAQAFGGGNRRQLFLEPGTLPSAGQAGASAFSSGVGSAFDNIAKYYLKLADQMFPVVEIDPGQKISFLMIHGARMGVLR